VGIGIEGVSHQTFEPDAARHEQPVLMHESQLPVCASERTLDWNGLSRRAGNECARTTFTGQLDAERRPECGRESDVLLHPGVQPARAACRWLRRIKRAHELPRDIRVAGFDALPHARRPRMRETAADLSRVVDAAGNPIDAAEHANRVRAEWSWKSALV